MTGNFAALKSIDPKFSAMKDLNPFKIVLKVQGASSILSVDYTLSKYPHFNSAYLIRVRFSLDLAVCSNISHSEVKVPVSFFRSFLFYMEVQ